MEIIIKEKEIYDEMGLILPPYVQEGYDINGFPTSRDEIIIIG